MQSSRKSPKAQNRTSSRVRIGKNRYLFLSRWLSLWLNTCLPPFLEPFSGLCNIDSPTLLPHLGKELCTLRFRKIRWNESIFNAEKPISQSDLFSQLMERLEKLEMSNAFVRRRRAGNVRGCQVEIGKGSSEIEHVVGVIDRI
jgi:hypothetical protein